MYGSDEFSDSCDDLRHRGGPRGSAGGGAEATLLVHYQFDQVDGGTTTPDASGNGLTSTLSGAVSTTPIAGQFVNALQFNGSGSNISVADESAGILNTTFAEFTVSAWIQPVADATSKSRWIAGKMGLNGSRG